MRIAEAQPRTLVDAGWSDDFAAATAHFCALAWVADRRLERRATGGREK
jgi:hypothetical protein